MDPGELLSMELFAQQNDLVDDKHFFATNMLVEFEKQQKATETKDRHFSLKTELYMAKRIVKELNVFFTDEAYKAQRMDFAGKVLYPLCDMMYDRVAFPYLKNYPREVHNWEFEMFEEALQLGWKIAGHCAAVEKIVEMFSDPLPVENLENVTAETIEVLKHIAMPGDQCWGSTEFVEFTAAKAKTALARISRNCDVGEATTSGMIRACKMKRIVTAEEISDEEEHFKVFHNQPFRKKATASGYVKDTRRVCFNRGCAEVERLEKFKLCSQCRKVAYCSRKCQKEHWKRFGHKQNCMQN